MKRMFTTLLLAALLPAAAAGATGPEPPAARPAPAARSSVSTAISSAPSLRTEEPNRERPGTQNGVAISCEDFTVPEPAVTIGDSAGEVTQAFIQPYTMPRFLGGDFTDFRRWVQARIRKPETVPGNDPRGRVIVAFTIDTLGRLTDISVLRTPDRALSDEAVRVLKTSPRWEPGLRYREKTPIRYTLPVDFGRPAIRPNRTEPQRTDPPRTDPASRDPAPARTKRGAARRSDKAGANAAKAEAAERNTAKADKAKPVTAGGNITKPVTAKENTAKPETARSNLPPADTLKADWKTGQAAGITQPAFDGGGFDAFRRWVEERAPKNPTALCDPPGGRAVISFVIDTLGRLTDIRVLRSPDRTLTDGAVRVLKISPRWEPGRQGARKVAVRYVLPVDFRQ